MRVLLALDGSAAAESARRLVRSLQWPQGTLIEVVGVLEPTIDTLGAGGLPLAAFDDAATDDALHALQGVLTGAVATLEAPGRVVTRALLKGRPGSAIVDEAVESRAELVVIGSRGLGPLRSMLLGSVSAEVVDHAPCPVLVVRGGSINRCLLAVDGSTAAQAAVTFLGASRYLTTDPVEVLTVAMAPRPPLPVPVAGLSDSAFESYDVAIRAHRDHAGEIASRAATALREAGVPARWSISQGDPAHEIIEAARSFGTGLVVIGSRGHTGLTRLLLGSVARNVLLHTEASVLVVREPLRVPSEERAKRSAADIGRSAGRLSVGDAVRPPASAG